jgi:hypothetical protein
MINLYVVLSGLIQEDTICPVVKTTGYNTKSLRDNANSSFHVNTFNPKDILHYIQSDEAQEFL